MLMYFNIYSSLAYAILHPLIFQWKVRRRSQPACGAAVSVCRAAVPVRPDGSLAPLYGRRRHGLPRSSWRCARPCSFTFGSSWSPSACWCAKILCTAAAARSSLTPRSAAQLGYVGNLGERVAWLVPFWILTVFPQALNPSNPFLPPMDQSCRPTRHESPHPGPPTSPPPSLLLPPGPSMAAYGVQMITQIYFLLSEAVTGWIVLPIESAPRPGLSALRLAPPAPAALPRADAPGT